MKSILRAVKANMLLTAVGAMSVCACNGGTEAEAPEVVETDEVMEVADVTEEAEAQSERIKETGRIVAEVAGWLEPYKSQLGMTIETDDDCTYIYGTFGDLPSIFSVLRITVAVNGDSGFVTLFGYLPTIVPKERRKEMVEFLFRGEAEYGLSASSFVLDDEGRVRCQACLPFDCFKGRSHKAKRRLLASVVDKLWAFSEGVAKVALGEDPKDAAVRIRRTNTFDRMFRDGESEDGDDAKADTKLVLERCFDKDSELTIGNIEDKWLENLSGQNEDDNVGVICAHFENVASDFGGRYDVIPYSFIVKDGMVWNVCRAPEPCPLDKVADVAEFAMKQNLGLMNSLFSVDFETGTVWNHYELPVSVIPEPPTEERPPKNLLVAFMKVVPVVSIARNSEELHSIMSDEEISETNEEEDTEIQASEDLAEPQTRESTDFEQPLSAWLDAHFTNVVWQVATNASGVVTFEGLVTEYGLGAEPITFSIEIDRTAGFLTARAMMPTSMPAERRNDIEELFLWSGLRYATSLSSIYLDDAMRIRCMASVPALAMRADADDAIWQVASAVIKRALICRLGLMRMKDGGKSPEDALKDIDSPETIAPWLIDDDYLGDPCDEDDELVESWLDEFNMDYQRSCCSALTAYFLNWNNKAGSTDKYPTSLLMSHKMVYCRCSTGVSMDESDIRDFAKKAAGYSASESVVTLRIDDFTGDAPYFQLAVPVSILRLAKTDSEARKCFPLMLEKVRREAEKLSSRMFE